jgi:hypothetical protein
MAEWDFLEGEGTLLHEPDVHCFLFLNKSSGLSARAILTNYRVRCRQLIFLPDSEAFLHSNRVRSEYFVVPWLMISSLESTVTREIVVIEVTTKDCRSLRFSFSSNSSAHMDIYGIICNHVNLLQLTDRFAFAYSFAEASFGWGLYNVVREFESQGVLDEPGSVKARQNWRLVDNREGIICPSYPSHFFVSRELCLDDLQSCAKFRKQRRLPALVWVNPTNRSTLWRSAQPSVNDR